MLAKRNRSISPKIAQVAGAILLLLPLATAAAQNTGNIPDWAVAMHREAMNVRDRGPRAHSPGVFPRVIPRMMRNPDESGTIGTGNLNAPTHTRSDPFFQSLGSNGRVCATCHEPRSAWSVSAASIRHRFNASKGTDPIFRPVDGATCPSDDVSTLAARRNAYRLLLSKGLIRISLPVPANQQNTNPPQPADFQISVTSDPYACTDLSADPPMVSMYRRPLPSSNLRFLTECPPGQASCTPLPIMWDGREPSLESQARDATLGHAQATDPPTDAQIAEIVNFESQIYDAQVRDRRAGELNARHGNGGPAFLSNQDFYIGINDSLGSDPLNPGVFNPDVFGLYSAWQNLPQAAGRNAARAAIARGEHIFNQRQFTIDNVNGLNLFAFDPLGANPMPNGTCTVCHDSPNVGHHSMKLAIGIGVSDADPPVLDVAELPVFRVECTDTSGPLHNYVFNVTDIGRAMISGKCADVGKVKGPILRGLAARAPYFHNGSAATLDDVVNFYDKRFNIGLTDADKADLLAFLKSL